MSKEQAWEQRVKGMEVIPVKELALSAGTDELRKSSI
jgi:hypothetical protein